MKLLAFCIYPLNWLMFSEKKKKNAQEKRTVFEEEKKPTKQTLPVFGVGT